MAWKTKKFGEICDILDSKRRPITKRHRTIGSYPYYGATGILDYVDNYIFDEKLILIGEDGAKWESGQYTAFIADGKYWVNNHAHVIRPHRNIVLDNWIIYFFYLNDLQKHTTGLTVPKLNQANLRNISIPLPTIPEQKKILKILDEVFEKIEKAKENAEKNLQNAKELFESYLCGIFINPNKNWNHCMLNDYVKFIDYRGKTPKKTLSGLPLITAKNIKMGFLKKEPQEFIDPKDYDKWMTRGIPQKGDVLFTTEAPLGMVAQLDTNEKVAFAQRTIIFQADKSKIDSTFLKYLLMSSSFQKKILEKGTGATVKGIKASLLKKLPIYFPSLKEQQSFVAILDTLSLETKKLETIYKQKLADLEELKKSVLQRAFNGDLC